MSEKSLIDYINAEKASFDKILQDRDFKDFLKKENKHEKRR